MILLKISAIIASKFFIRACRLIKRGGTSLPGKIARAIYPNILKEISADFKIIMVTGTNGKTTTTRIIARVLQENGIDYITNKSGANLVSGIITTFVNAANILGKPKANTALLEIDEAAFKVITNHIEPNVLVVTNFFRDQLDRYGELYSTLRGVQEGISRCKNTTLILNADDSLCASLGQYSEKEVIYYGFDSLAYNNTQSLLASDASFCIFCKEKYSYTFRTYSHLGGYRCPNCGYKRPFPHVAITKIHELHNQFSHIQFEICENEETCQNASAKVNLPGLYNIYNALAGVAVAKLLALPIEKTVTALESFECGFGRMESIDISGKQIKLILVKNPTGFNQVLDFLLTENKNFFPVFSINDNLADGTDVSWLWDVDFEKLTQIQDKVEIFYTSGNRAEDMAVRLKYAGIPSNKIEIINNYNTLIKRSLARLDNEQNLYILPTYTAMLDIRDILRGKYKLKEFWK